MNQITHWLDASNIYGSEEKVTEELRSKKDGRLRSTSVRGHPYDNLPRCEVEFKGVGEHSGRPESCSIGGAEKPFGAGIRKIN